MLPTPLLQALFQQAQAAGQANNDIFNTPRADFSAGLPSAPIAPVVLPQQLGGRASGGAIDKALQNPMRQTEMAGNMETRAREKRAKEVGKTPGFPINEGTAWTTLGASALLRLLGADHNSVMGGVQNFLGGMQGLQNQREQARLAEVQGQFEAEMSKAQKLEQIANYNAKRVAEIEDRKERGRTRAAELILRASEAKNPAQATALLKEAQRIGGNVSREEIGGTLSRAGERMMATKAEEEIALEGKRQIAKKREHDSFRLNQVDPILKIIGQLGESPTGTVRDNLKAKWDRLQAQADKIGYELPDFDLITSATIRQRNADMAELRQNDLSEYRRQLFANKDRDFNQRLVEFESQKREREERIATMRQKRTSAATGEVLSPADKAERQEILNGIMKDNAWLRDLDQKSRKPGQSAELRAEFAAMYTEVRSDLVSRYNEIIAEHGAKSDLAQVVYKRLRGNGVPVEPPDRQSAAIQSNVQRLMIPTPAGPVNMDVPANLGGQASGQPGVPFRRGP